MANPRYVVTTTHGIAYRNNDNVRWDSTVVKTVSTDTVRKYVRSLREWASGTYDWVRDQQYSDYRVVTAHHMVSGVDNVRQLRISPAWLP